MDLITLADVRAAAHLIAPHLPPTPVLALPTLREGLWVKAENLTPVGAFKLRGALNAVAHLPVDARAAGVVTHSSGNHGAALAYAAKAADIPCVVVVPDSAIASKVAAVRRLGAEVLQVPVAERAEQARRVAAERGMTVVPPFDHADVIAGQGTVGVELLEQRPDVAVVLVPVGGGGLASGVATAVKALRPDVRVYGVEPELAGDAAQSLAEGRLVSWPLADTGRTIADGLRTGLSELTFAHLRAHLDGVLTVSEEEIRRATGALIRASRTLVEPSGAVAAAAALSGVAPEGRTVAVVSGGNIEPRLLRELLPE
ncbi:pyridoxal-phosphate dependent enzyme [Spiractinospora alimapuensis]|uniref:threonine ammonia-lyase n=1 Tax=Spiractinospora alimapuensis TaxID=2820884 RepID=UPI001F15D09D|nr:pyridoxal-phosphate dependent enzyme [Spiractinospora alimapuensis]QVQ52589.1 pyridoxal-phosphate dependent enzyme [Spiractinospora alimapuensis]